MTFKDCPQRQKVASFIKSEAKKQNVWRQLLLIKPANSKSLKVLRKTLQKHATSLTTSKT
jgi:hypothetical protein